MPRTTSLNNKAPIGMLIGRRLKKLGKTQKWLALEAGLSKNHICNIINGKTVPSLLVLKKIARVTELDELDLFNALSQKLLLPDNSYVIE